jgi:microcystin-dependent protein
MEPYIGQIIPFVGTHVPYRDYWLECLGQHIRVSENTALYSIIGTTYGGDGVTTFCLPNLAGLVPVGAGKSPVSNKEYIQGQTGGKETITLTLANLPAHNHTVFLDTNSPQQLPIKGSIEWKVSTKNDGQGLTANKSVLANNDIYTKNTSSQVALNSQSVSHNLSIDLANLAAGSIINVASAGGGEAFSVMQPYLVIKYLIAIAGIYPARS